MFSDLKYNNSYILYIYIYSDLSQLHYIYIYIPMCHGHYSNQILEIRFYFLINFLMHGMQSSTTVHADKLHTIHFWEG